MKETEASIKISRAKIKLQRNEPFFTFLSLFLKPKEIKDKKKWEEGGLGMAVDIQGNLYYSPDFVNKLRDDELVGVIVHEILHLSLLHLIRGKNFNKKVSNISQDIVVNQILKENNFVLPKGVIWSNENNEVKILGKVIKDIGKKTAEDIYWELYENIKEKLKQQLKEGKAEFSDGNEDGIEIDIDELGDYEFEGSTNNGEGKIKNFDRHIQGKGEDGEELSEEEESELEKEWISRTIDASQVSRIAGKEPKGLDRIIKGLHQSQIGWKQLLQKYIQSYCPSNYTYARPSKKSISTGIYLPDVEREQVEVSVLIDCSGSIGNDELSDFLSEIIGISKTFREKLKITLGCHETNLTSDWVVANGNCQKILDNTKIKGGGGTSFAQPYKEFIDKHKDTKVIIWLTDGAGDTLEKKDLKCDIIWVLCKNGYDELIKNTGKVIKLR